MHNLFAAPGKIEIEKLKYSQSVHNPFTITVLGSVDHHAQTGPPRASPAPGQNLIRSPPGQRRTFKKITLLILFFLFIIISFKIYTLQPLAKSGTTGIQYAFQLTVTELNIIGERSAIVKCAYRK